MGREPIGDGSAVPASIEWTYDIPLLTNRFMLFDIVRVVLISVASMYLLVAACGLLVEQELIVLPPLVFLVTTGIVLALFVFASLLMGNRIRARFVVGPDAVEYHAQRRERALSRLTIIAGLLARDPGVAGAGVLAATRERSVFPWTGIHRVVVHPRQRVISLRNSWRTVLRLHCPPELFDQVQDTVEHYQRAAHPEEGVGGRR